MMEILNKKRLALVKFTFCLVAILLTVAVNFDHEIFTITLRCLSLPLLILLYWMVSEKKSKTYVTAMFFAALSNVMFIYSSLDFILIGLIAFMCFRILILSQVFIKSEKIFAFPFIIGFMFFVIPNTYLFYITSENLGVVFYIGLINIFVNSLIGGFSISNYSNQANLANITLLISSILFVVLSVLFIIQKFYIYIDLYEPLRVVVLLAAHYFYYLYLILSEKHNK